MTDKLLIERELLERIDETAICDGTDATISDDLFTQLVAALAAPRQQEGEGLEVVGYRCWFKKEPENIMAGWGTRMPTCPNPHAEYEELCRLSDALRAIAELREEISDLHTTMMAAAVEIQEHWQAHCDEEGYGPSNLMHRLERGIASQYGYTAQTLVQIEAERDTLRQQLADSDAALRESRANDQAAMAHLADMRQQRDKLAGLLREVLNWSEPDLEQRIDAALAEVKP